MSDSAKLQEIYQAAKNTFSSEKIWEIINNSDLSNKDKTNLIKLLELCLPNHNPIPPKVEISYSPPTIFKFEQDDIDMKLDPSELGGKKPIYEVVSHNPNIVGY
jgi:hypothetical protein